MSNVLDMADVDQDVDMRDVSNSKQNNTHMKPVPEDRPTFNPPPTLHVKPSQCLTPFFLENSHLFSPPPPFKIENKQTKSPTKKKPNPSNPSSITNP